MLRKKIWVLLSITLLLLLVGCAGTKPAQQPALDDHKEAIGKEIINVGVLQGPTGMGIVKLMEEENYNIEIVGSPDDLIGKIITGEIDLAAMPTNMASILYQRTGQKIQLLAINTLGVLYILENGEEIGTIADLKGKTLYVSGKGATPDYVIQYLLEEHGLTPGKDVILDFSTQHADLAAIMAAGQHDLALLPQPHVTSVLMQNKDVRIALDLTKEWKDILNAELPMGVLIGQKDFIDSNENLLSAFLEEYQKSIEFVNTNTDEAAELIAKHKILPNAQIAKNAIPYSNIVYIDAQSGKSSLHEFFSILYAYNPESIGGQIPDDGFYY
ncbi:MAG: ABC transporter substrate-binding protein [Firmicutes bacterium]|nr:ABC transporter substrate-binding protein [Bacillota bacterium]